MTSLRPYKLYDARAKKFLFGRWYRWEENAHDAATIMCRRDMKIGCTIEVIEGVRLIATYTKRVSGIEIKRRRQLRLEERR